MANLKELTKKRDIITPGHRMCAGCMAPVVVRQALNAVKTPVVVGSATGCLEVATTIYPYTAWNCSFIHNAFENSAATISGVETAYRALKKKGKIKDEIKFIAMGGDGGTYDIGLQSLSGAMERGHNMVYICYDNEAYMNTGTQRSSATPMGASTTTAPAGKKVPGKTVFQKDLTGIMASHRIPYVAQASPHNWHDLIAKMEKALEIDGPCFLNIISPCPRGWMTKTEDGIMMAKLAVETCFWPLYEVEDGRRWKVNYKPSEKKPITDWINIQGRFKHLQKPENKHIVERMQEKVDRDWNDLLKKEECLSK
ncbi:MAG TPA: pyruvate ferredoxin oxidoreductase [Candidatus Altiarchaeales archaeon]|nr:pyruvate ferredoxin oxidoreductase [Candidatus Altiarchaeales archaeon]